MMMQFVKFYLILKCYTTGTIHDATCVFSIYVLFSFYITSSSTWLIESCSTSSNVAQASLSCLKMSIKISLLLFKWNCTDPPSAPSSQTHAEPRFVKTRRTIERGDPIFQIYQIYSIFRQCFFFTILKRRGDRMRKVDVKGLNRGNFQQILTLFNSSIFRENLTEL